MPANTDEKKMLPPVLERALGTYDWLEVGYLSGDKGYDGRWLYDYLWEEMNIKPIIPMKRPPMQKNGKRSLYDGIYDRLGRPTCDRQTAMEFVATDSVSGKHLYRCPASGCSLASRSSGAMRYCADLHWEDPQDNPKVIGVIARDSDEFKERYGRRQTVERAFGSLKRSRTLGKHYFLSYERVYAHASLCLTTYVATMVSRVLMGQVSAIRHMGLEMPSVSVQAAAA